ncbi:MAG: hypothetical protein ACPGGA_01310 [Balneolaceae bacterium]
MYRYVFFVLLAAVFQSSCTTTSSFVIGSNYDPSFDINKLDNLSIIYFKLDDSDNDYWGHRSNRGSEPKSVEAKLYTDLVEVFDEEKIKINDNRLNADSTEWESISNEVESIKQYLIDLDRMGTQNFSFSSSVEYSKVVDEGFSGYALLMKIDPYSVVSSSTTPSFGADGSFETAMMMSSSSQHYEYSVFAYIVDISTNKVVWVFNNSEYVDLYKFDKTIPHKTALAALFLGKDYSFESFDLITEESAKITDQYDEVYFGKVIAIDGFTIQIELSDSTIEKKIDEIKEITINATKTVASRNRQVVETLFPKYLK